MNGAKRKVKKNSMRGGRGPARGPSSLRAQILAVPALCAMAAPGAPRGPEGRRRRLGPDCAHSSSHSKYTAAQERQARHPADINTPLREAGQEKVTGYQDTYANDHNISFMPAIFSTSAA
jgi:hypothetical protein